MAVEITSGGTVTLSDTDIVCSIVSTTVDDFGFIEGERLVLFDFANILPTYDFYYEINPKEMEYETIFQIEAYTIDEDEYLGTIIVSVPLLDCKDAICRYIYNGGE